MTKISQWIRVFTRESIDSKSLTFCYFRSLFGSPVFAFCSLLFTFVDFCALFVHFYSRFWCLMLSLRINEVNFVERITPLNHVSCVQNKSMNLRIREGIHRFKIVNILLFWRCNWFTCVHFLFIYVHFCGLLRSFCSGLFKFLMFDVILPNKWS